MRVGVVSGLLQAARSAFSAYGNALRTHPIPTKVLTGAVTGAAGDAIAQRAEGKRELSLRRVAAFALGGGIVTAPIYHVAYSVLEHTSFHLSTKVLLDIFCITPVWYVLFMPVVTIVRRSDDVLAMYSDSDCRHRNSTAVKAALVDNASRVATLTLAVLLPAETINFAFVPLPMRVPYLCMVDLAFVVGVSIIANRHALQPHAPSSSAVSSSSSLIDRP